MITVSLLFMLAIQLLEPTCNGLKQQKKPSAQHTQFTLERVECPWYNRSILKNFLAKSYKYNRTTTTFNLVLDFITDVTNNFYKDDLTQYKLIAIQFPMKTCQYMKHNLFGVGLLKTHGNFTDCPIKKGLYVVKHIVIEAGDFPPNFPASRWKLEVKAFVNGDYAIDLEIYFKLDYTS